jgi:hypothetical protein
MSRRLIREKVYSLINNKTSFGPRVFRSRKVPLEHDEECNNGVILIYIEKESSSIFNDSPREYKRTLTLSVAVMKTMLPEDIERIEDQVDVVAEKIEEILGKNDDLGGLASDVVFDGYEFINNEEGEFKEGATKLTYSITYYIATGLEESDLDDFKKSHIEIKQDENSDFQLDLIHSNT